MQHPVRSLGPSLPRSQEPHAKFNPIDEAILAEFSISGKMKNIAGENQILSSEKRLESLAEQIAMAGYALACLHETNDTEFDLRDEFENALRKAEIA